MNRGKNVVQWIFAGIFLTAALGTGFGIGTLFCILAAVLMAPIKFLRNKIKLPRAIIIILSVVLCFSGVLLSPTESTEKQGVLGQQQISKEDKEDKEDKEKGEIQEGDKEAEDNEREPIGSEQSAVNDSSLVEVYTGVAYTVINDNIPSFSSEELTTTGYEKYSDLDSLGRCRVAIASCGREIMPKAGEDRGSISSVKPSGWVQVRRQFSGQ